MKLRRRQRQRIVCLQPVTSTALNTSHSPLHSLTNSPQLVICLLECAQRFEQTFEVMAENTASLTTPTSYPQQQQPLPRVAIQFCTQCKWMLRAAYVSSRRPSRRSTRIIDACFLRVCLSPCLPLPPLASLPPLHLPPVDRLTDADGKLSTPKNCFRPSQPRSAK